MYQKAYKNTYGDITHKNNLKSITSKVDRVWYTFVMKYYMVIKRNELFYYYKQQK